MISNNWEENGFIGPIKALTEKEILPITNEVRNIISNSKDFLQLRNKHLYSKLIQELCLNEIIINAVKDLMGSNLILWRTQIFKVNKNQGFGWHQDQYRTLLSEPTKHISLQIALTKSTEDNCVFFIPGSHKMNSSELNEAGLYLEENCQLNIPQYYRSFKSSIKPVKMILEPGEFFIFHPSTLHASFDRRKEHCKAPKTVNQGSFLPVGRLWNRTVGVFNSLNFQSSPRLGVAMRITVPEVKVLPTAFEKTLPRIDKCVLLHGSNENGVNELDSWSVNDKTRVNEQSLIEVG
ncbi:phytanoyl-CoA dioxygenase family protein [Gloeothece citriformis]|nr:phytanoyl-CoA dioxygenase family protein [Gloeothece citriformis]